MGFLEKIFGNYSDKELKRIRPIADKVMALEDEMAAGAWILASVAGGAISGGALGATGGMVTGIVGTAGSDVASGKATVSLSFMGK